MSRERRVILLREESNSFKISGRDLFLKQHPYAHVGYIFMCFNLHMLQIFFCINVILKQKFLCLLFKFLKQNKTSFYYTLIFLCLASFKFIVFK